MALAAQARELIDWRLRAAGLLAVAAACGTGAGWGVTRYGLAICLVTLLGIPAVILALRSIWFAFAATIGVMTVLPFFVLPLSAGGARPTLFEVAAAGLLVAYLAILLLDGRERIVVGLPVAAWLVFVLYLTFALLLGARFGLGLDLVRLFSRFGLALALFWLTVQLVRKRDDAVRIMAWIVTGSTAAAAFALLLYAGGVALTLRVLSQLTPYGYPHTRVVRFIEDNPQNAMRAIGTSIDPNAFGGMMMIGFVLAVGLAFSRGTSIPAPLIWSAIGLTGLAVLLSYSRGAWIGSAVGAGIIVWFRARALVPLAGLAGAAVVTAGLGAGFVSRLEAGLRLQDSATRQRFDEYDNAIAIIREHPWFGIGFGSAPSPEFGVGVSSIYLLLAEQAGLVGLAGFLLLVLLIGRRGLRAYRRTQDDVMLTVGAALAASLTVGLVDHYFFNIRFVHMVALFWILAGLMVALTERALAEHDGKGAAG